MKFNIEKLESYTIIPNNFIDDKRLSLKEKGLLVTMYRLPNDWDYSMQGLAKITKTGITALRNIIADLEVHGYIERKQERTEKGTFDYNYYVYAKPKKNNVKNSLSIKRYLKSQEKN